MTDVHRAAAEGFAKRAESYRRGRPGYPAALTAWLRDVLQLGPGAIVIDLGAGTGKFTARLLETGARVIAVEPVEAMRRELTRAFSDVECLDATAEHLPVPEAHVDAVTCAQSFHWFASTAVLAEIRRVLRPGGRLGLVWNVRDERVPWVAALGRIVASCDTGETPQFSSGAWRTLFPAPGFTPLEETRFPHVHVGPPEQVVLERTLSVSFIAALPPEEQDAVAARIRELIACDPALAGQDEVAFPYQTLAATCAKI